MTTLELIVIVCWAAGTGLGIAWLVLRHFLRRYESWYWDGVAALYFIMLVLGFVMVTG